MGRGEGPSIGCRECLIESIGTNAKQNAQVCFAALSNRNTDGLKHLVCNRNGVRNDGKPTREIVWY